MKPFGAELAGDVAEIFGVPRDRLVDLRDLGILDGVGFASLGEFIIIFRAGSETIEVDPPDEEITAEQLAKFGQVVGASGVVVARNRVYGFGAKVW